MAVDQSGIQTFIQNMNGTQTTAQGAVPGAVNNGNPATIYNSPHWGTYVPTTVPGQVPGQAPSTSFNYVTAPYQPSQPGYVSPFAADPTVAMVMSSMPQATGNANVNRILNNFLTRRPNAPAPNPSGPGPTPPPTTNPPPAGPPGGPGGPGRPGRPGPRPVGPISGAVDDWITGRTPGNGPPDTTAPTNLFDNQQGREYALDWLRQNRGSNFESVADYLQQNGGFEGVMGQASNESGTGWWDSVQSLFGGIVDNIRGEIGDLSWQQVLDMVTESIVPGDWYDSETGEWNNPLEAFGVDSIVNTIQSMFGDGDEPVTEEQLAQLEEALSESSAETIAQNAAEAITLIQQALDTGELDTREDLEDWYNRQGEWSAEEWQDMQESMSWNNFWHGSDQAGSYNSSFWGRQPTLGVGPALDNVDVFLRQMNDNALRWTEYFRNLAGNRER